MDQHAERNFLSYLDFKDIIRGANRNDLNFRHFYQRVEGNVTEINLENFEIEAGELNKVELANMISPLNLIIRNCKLGSISVRGKINSLHLIDCEVLEIFFERDNTITFDVSGPYSKIGLIEMEPGRVYNFNLDSYVGKIRFKGANNTWPIDVNLKGNIGVLDIDSIIDLRINCSALIRM